MGASSTKTAPLRYRTSSCRATSMASRVFPTPPGPGSFTFAPSDTTLPTYTGHATDWFGESDNRQNTVMHSTFNAQAHAPDGSHLDMHETFHYSVSATGVTVAFDNVSC